jgi:hypothetical protein
LAGKKEAAEAGFAKLKRIEEDMVRMNDLYKKVVETPRDLKPRFELGQILLRNNKEIEGLRFLHSVLKAQPEHKPAHLALAEYYSRAGKKDLAQKHRESAEARQAPATPAEQYKALRKEYDIATGSGVPLTDAERLKFIGRVYKHHFAVAAKFVDLAEKHPKDPVALDCLMQAVWQVNTTPWPVELVGEDAARARAFELIQRDHIQSDKIGPLCQRVSYGFCKEYETFLRAVAEKNPHNNIRAAASLALGHFLNSRLQRLDLCKEEPTAAKEFAELYGKEYLAALLRQDRDKAGKEIETVFEQAAEKYGDIKLPDDVTVAERAKTELFEIRNLSPGKPAPDIEGEDQDGKRFKLSDYRGKVVLLDFWSYV